MKKFTALLLVLCMVLGLAACSNSAEGKPTEPQQSPSTQPTQSETQPPEKVESLNIYGIYKSESAYFVNEAASIEKTLNELGEKYDISVTWHFQNCDGDPEKFMTQVDTAIADSADAIICCIPDQTMSEAVVLKCESAGIPIIACDDPLKDGDNNKIAPWFGIDAYNIGYAAGEWMADYATTNNLTDDTSVGLLYMTMNTISSCVPRFEGEQKAWADKLGDAMADRTYVVDYVTTMEDAYNGASSMIAGHPEIKTWLVMVASEAGALGSASALENAGLAESSCIVTLGCDETTGHWAEGNYSVIRSAAYFSGKVVGKEAITAVVEHLVNGAEIPLEYATPAVIVTPENYKDIVL